MRIFVMGGTGFTGGPLINHLIQSGHEVTGLARSAERAEQLPSRAIPMTGDPLRPGKWQEAAGRADVIINLVGSPIMARWTRDARRKIMESRLLATQMAVQAIPADRGGRMTLINGNAVGYYGGAGDTRITEKSPRGNGFLAEVAWKWQQEAETAAEKGARVVVCRFGAVLGRGGGALSRMVPPFRLGLGGRLGSGKQWFSWIHMQDLVRAILFVAEQDSVAGVVNMCAPESVTNRELTKALAEVLNRPAFLPVPGFILRLALGGSAEIAIKGQRVFPEVLHHAGFRFDFPRLEEALRDLIHRK